MRLNKTETIDFTSSVIRISEPVNLFWSSLGLFILAVSMIKFEKKKLWGYGGVFWVSITIGFLLMLIPRAVMSADDGDLYNKYAVYVTMAVSNAFTEFAFSLVILALKSLNNLFLLKNHKTEKIWLLFNACQIPVNCVIVIVQIFVGESDENIYWNNIFLCIAQMINIGVFYYFYKKIKTDIESATLTEDTFLLLSNILTRFVDFYFAYIIYATLCLFGMIATFSEIAGANLKGILHLWTIWILGSQPAKVYALLCALYIFQPYWYLLLTKVTRENGFGDGAVKGGPSGTMLSRKPISNQSNLMHNNSSNSRYNNSSRSNYGEQAITIISNNNNNNNNTGSNNSNNRNSSNSYTNNGHNNSNSNTLKRELISSSNSKKDIVSEIQLEHQRHISIYMEGEDDISVDHLEIKSNGTKCEKDPEEKACYKNTAKDLDCVKVDSPASSNSSVQFEDVDYSL